MSSHSCHDRIGLYSGHSMEGTFVPGDKLKTRVTSFSSLVPGDVILFERKGKKIVHRIVGGSAETGWITRGDHNSWDDPWFVVAEDEPCLVVFRIDLRGNSFPVLQGRKGLEHHRALQKKWKCLGLISRMVPAWCRQAPFRFLLPHRQFSTARFADLTVLYWGKKEIARKQGGKMWCFRKSWMRLFFPLPEK